MTRSTWSSSVAAFLLVVLSSIPCLAEGPSIQVSGEPIVVESVVHYFRTGWLTNHLLPIDVPPSSGGQLRLFAVGDFGHTSETASVSIEGVPVVTLDQTGADCVTQEAVYELEPEALDTFAADGQVMVAVQNAPSVASSCPQDRHTVRLEYDRPKILDFGAMFVGQRTLRVLRIRNAGDENLIVSSISSDVSELAIQPAAMVVPPGFTFEVKFWLLPTQAGAINALVEIVSNDPQAPLLQLPILATVTGPPVSGVQPLWITAQTITGAVETHPLWISNTGAHDLTWEMQARVITFFETLDASPVFPPTGLADPDKEEEALPPPPTDTNRYTFAPQEAVPAETVFPPPNIYSVRQDLDERFREITDLVPDLHLFTQGETGFTIFDGGDDMYDTGNLMTVDGTGLEYTDGRIETEPFTGTRYFTQKYPGLFVATLDTSGAHSFQVSGNLGADGFGSVDGLVLEASGTIPYRGFVKRVYGAGDPSVNHMFLIPQSETVGHAFSTDSNEDYHEVFNLSTSRRIYYLVYASKDGAFIDDGTTREIMQAFIDIVEPLWLELEPTTGVIPPGESQEVTVTLDAFQRFLTLRADIQLDSNDPVRPTNIIPVTLNIQAAPDILISGGTVVVESESKFASSYRLTEFVLPIPVAPEGRGLLEVFSNGDFDNDESVVYAEGMELGPTGKAPSCQEAVASLDIPSQTLDLLAADGKVVVSIDTDRANAWSCDVSRHRVRLSYPGPSDRVVIGPLFPGETGTGGVTVESHGFGTLEVAVSTENSKFASSPASISIPFRGSVPVEVSLTAEEPGLAQGSLLLATNDPDEPNLTVPLTAEVIPPPQAEAAPATLRAFLPLGGQTALPFTVTNAGDSDLDYRVDVSGPGGQGQGFLRARGVAGSRVEARIAYDEATAPPRITAAGLGSTDGVESLTVVFLDPTGKPVRTVQDVVNGVSNYGQLAVAYDVEGVDFRPFIFIGEVVDNSDFAQYFLSPAGHFLIQRSGADSERVNDITFQAWPPFLDLDRTEGSLQAGEGEETLVLLDATDYFPGTFLADVDIHSNDPARPRVTIPLTVTLFENLPPEAAILAPGTVECTSPAGTMVTLDGSTSGDPNTYPGEYDDILSYEWFDSFGAEDQVFLGSGPILEAELGLGGHDVTLRLTDRSGLVDLESTFVAVVDATPPGLTVSVTPQELWPPNHRLVPVTASITADDLCGDVAVVLESLISSEDDDAPGSLDGRTRDDVQEAETGVQDESFLLRAERLGGGPGRTYVATYRAVDTQGNWTTAAGTVFVPHDQGDGNGEPLLLSVQETEFGTRLDWSPVAGATAYSVVRGDLADLLDDGEVYQLGSLACMAVDLLAPGTAGAEDPERPGPGQAFFYLAEYQGALRSGVGTSGASRERVAAAGSGCP